MRSEDTEHKHDVEEVVQQTSMIAWKKSEELEDLDRFGGWLMTIARYEALKYRRSLARSPLVFSVSYLRTPPPDGPTFKAYRQSQIYYSPPICGAGGRRWHHVAVTFDSTTGEAVQYFDGNEVRRAGSEHHQGGRKVTLQ